MGIRKPNSVWLFWVRHFGFMSKRKFGFLHSSWEVIKARKTGTTHTFLDYVVYRLFYVLSLCGISVYKLAQTQPLPFLIYFETWALGIHTLYSFLFLRQVLVHNHHMKALGRRQKMPEQIIIMDEIEKGGRTYYISKKISILPRNPLSAFEKIVWVMFSISATLSFVAFVAVEFNLDILVRKNPKGNKAPRSNYQQSFLVFVSFAMTFVDVFVNTVPMRWGHFIYGVLICLLYFVIAYTYDQTVSSKIHLYEQDIWNYPSNLKIVGLAVLCHLIIVCLAHLRDFIVSLLDRTRTQAYQQQIRSQKRLARRKIMVPIYGPDGQLDRIALEHEPLAPEQFIFMNFEGQGDDWAGDSDDATEGVTTVKKVDTMVQEEVRRKSILVDVHKTPKKAKPEAVNKSEEPTATKKLKLKKPKEDEVEKKTKKLKIQDDEGQKKEENATNTKLQETAKKQNPKNVKEEVKLKAEDASKSEEPSAEKKPKLKKQMKEDEVQIETEKKPKKPKKKKPEDSETTLNEDEEKAVVVKNVEDVIRVKSPPQKTKPKDLEIPPAIEKRAEKVDEMEKEKVQKDKPDIDNLGSVKQKPSKKIKPKKADPIIIATTDKKPIVERKPIDIEEIRLPSPPKNAQATSKKPPGQPGLIRPPKAVEQNTLDPRQKMTKRPSSTPTHPQTNESETAEASTDDILDFDTQKAILDKYKRQLHTKVKKSGILTGRPTIFVDRGNISKNDGTPEHGKTLMGGNDLELEAERKKYEKTHQQHELLRLMHSGRNDAEYHAPPTTSTSAPPRKRSVGGAGTATKIQQQKSILRANTTSASKKNSLDRRQSMNKYKRRSVLRTNVQSQRKTKAGTMDPVYDPVATPNIPHAKTAFHYLDAKLARQPEQGMIPPEQISAFTKHPGISTFHPQDNTAPSNTKSNSKDMKKPPQQPPQKRKTTLHTERLDHDHHPDDTESVIAFHPLIQYVDLDKGEGTTTTSKKKKKENERKS